MLLRTDEEDELKARIEGLREVQMPSPEAISSMIAEDFRKFGEQLWAICRTAILYWTPSRLELESLRRASDGVESTIAIVAALIVQKYQTWVPGQHLLEAQLLDPGQRAIGPARIVLAGSFVRERLRESIEMLERRAVVVEARALDLRLRVDHQKLVAELFGKQLQSTLTEALELARSQAADTELERIAQRLDHLSVIAPRVETIAKEVEFIADQSMLVFAERKMQPQALKALEKVGSIVTSSVGKIGMTYLIKRFLSGA